MRNFLDSEFAPAVLGIIVSIIGVAYAVDAAWSGVTDLRVTGNIRLVLREGDTFFFPYLMFLGVGGLAIGVLSLRDLAQRR
ncbi:MAG: hypothetical protein AAFU38_09805 [Bacteroidota bacterium]